MPLTDPLIGKQLGDYLIQVVLGTGGMARVYRGYDDNLERYAAIKVIEPQLLASNEEDDYRERFLREARSIARLNHPNIVSVYQFNQIGSLYYIAMEYAEGANLREIIKNYIQQGRLMPTAELLKVMKDMADALDYAHRQSIIHRDVKPSNIIVTPEGKAVLTDFGLALNATEGTIGNTFGSVHYIAPEQAVASAQAVPQSDQYSLAIVAYELLTGRVPFDDASAMSIALKHIGEPPPPPSYLNANIPPEVEEVILRALAKEPEKRFNTAKDFVNALEMAFTMFDNADIALPDDLALISSEGQPATAAFPPLKNAIQDSHATKVYTSPEKRFKIATDQAAETTEEQHEGNRLWLIAGGLTVLAILVSALVFNLSSNEQSAITRTVAMLAQESTLAADSTATYVASASVTSIINDQVTTNRSQTTITALAMSETTTPQSPALADATTAQRVATATATIRASATPFPTITPTPEFLITDETDARQLLLRYDGRSFIATNRDRAMPVNFRELTFVLFELDERGLWTQTELFEMSNSRLGNSAIDLRAQRCLQLLDTSLFNGLPTPNSIADDVCVAPPTWATTHNVFWVSSQPAAYFEVRLGSVDIIGVCEAQQPLTRAEKRCALDINTFQR